MRGSCSEGDEGGDGEERRWRDDCEEVSDTGETMDGKVDGGSYGVDYGGSTFRV